MKKSFLYKIDTQNDSLHPKIWSWDKGRIIFTKSLGHFLLEDNQKNKTYVSKINETNWIRQYSMNGRCSNVSKNKAFFLFSNIKKDSSILYQFSIDGICKPLKAMPGVYGEFSFDEKFFFTQSKRLNKSFLYAIKEDKKINLIFENAGEEAEFPSSSEAFYISDSKEEVSSIGILEKGNFHLLTNNVKGFRPRLSGNQQTIMSYSGDGGQVYLLNLKTGFEINFDLSHAEMNSHFIHANGLILTNSVKNGILYFPQIPSSDFFNEFLTCIIEDIKLKPFIENQTGYDLN